MIHLNVVSNCSQQDIASFLVEMIGFSLPFLGELEVPEFKIL